MENNSLVQGFRRHPPHPPSAHAPHWGVGFPSYLGNKEEEQDPQWKPGSLSFLLQQTLPENLLCSRQVRGCGCCTAEGKNTRSLRVSWTHCLRSKRRPARQSQDAHIHRAGKDDVSLTSVAAGCRGQLWIQGMGGTWGSRKTTPSCPPQIRTASLVFVPVLLATHWYC